MHEMIASGLIYRSGYARKINDAKVDDLVSSIREVGLLNPISVRKMKRHKGTELIDAFDIVAGHHRYEALCKLKHLTIPCFVVELNDLRAELAEIDENLIRCNFTPAEEAQAISRRKAIYEELYPETKHGGNVGGPCGEFRHTVTTRFTSATAEATGKSERSVREIAARGKALGSDLSLIAGTSLDKAGELDALAKMPPEARKPIIDRARAGERVSAKPPKLAADPLDDTLASERQVARLMDAWNAAGPEARQEFLCRIDQPVMDRRYGA